MTLDVSTKINSLTLGGASNGTTPGITDIGLPETLTITNALNVGTTGYISFSEGSKISAGANSSNAGQIDLENKSTLKVTGDLLNTGRLGTNLMLFGGGNTINLTGTLTNSGNVGLNGPGDVATVGNGVSNSGTLDAENGSTLKITGDVTNTGTLATDMNGRGGGKALHIKGQLTNTNSFTLGGPMDILTTTGTATHQSLFSVTGTGSMATPWRAWSIAQL